MELAGFRRDLADIAESGRLRSLRLVEGRQDAEITLDGQRVILLCSNNYLGLAQHPALISASVEAAQHFGVSSTASRLISGNMLVHEELEQALAYYRGTEAALLFNSGYQANIGAIAALSNEQDVVLSDELNHASLIDGCRLAKARKAIYAHNDLDALESDLRNAHAARRRFVVIESVYSMDGDLAPLGDICNLADIYGAHVIVDEAHAVGIFGETGAGRVEELGLQDRVLLQIGTFGKALASFGAYCAGPQVVIDLLRNKARSFIFSTALPPSVVAVSATALQIVARESSHRESLWRNVERFRRGLHDLGFHTGDSQSQIMPVLIGSEEKTMQVCESLLKFGVYAQGIRPPTVAPGTSRLRCTLMATHSEKQLSDALAAFAEVAEKLQLA